LKFYVKFKKGIFKISYNIENSWNENISQCMDGSSVIRVIYRTIFGGYTPFHGQMAEIWRNIHGSKYLHGPWYKTNENKKTYIDSTLKHCIIEVFSSASRSITS